jgi:LPS sulfotransferase NodH
VKKFFIVGCPRSGTTMLQQALNRHSQIAIPPETKFFFSFFGRSHRCQLRHLERLNNDLGIDLPPHRHRLRSPAEASAFYERMAGLYAERLRRSALVYFGEKTPEHTGRLHRIHSVFPDAKIIFLYRDGRDVALSLAKVAWMRRDLYVNFVLWLYYYRVLMRVRNDTSLDLYCVRYEDLVSDPSGELAKIASFLGVDYEAAMAQGHGNREGIPEREYPWKARALEPITRERVGVWRRELSPTQVQILESLGGRALRTLGYQTSTKWIQQLPFGLFPRLAWNLVAMLLRLPWDAVMKEFFDGSARLAMRGAQK